MRYANEVPKDDLYIPHGSDERLHQKVVPASFASAFISHMVQMKVRKTMSLQDNLTILYIPHGSDESEKDAVSQAVRKVTLYPTWFR